MQGSMHADKLGWTRSKQGWAKAQGVQARLAWPPAQHATSLPGPGRAQPQPKRSCCQARLAAQVIPCWACCGAPSPRPPPPPPCPSWSSPSCPHHPSSWTARCRLHGGGQRGKGPLATCRSSVSKKMSAPSRFLGLPKTAAPQPRAWLPNFLRLLVSHPPPHPSCSPAPLRQQPAPSPPIPCNTPPRPPRAPDSCIDLTMARRVSSSPPSYSSRKNFHRPCGGQQGGGGAAASRNQGPPLSTSAPAHKRQAVDGAPCPCRLARQRSVQAGPRLASGCAAGRRLTASPSSCSSFSSFFTSCASLSQSTFLLQPPGREGRAEWVGGGNGAAGHRA